MHAIGELNTDLNVLALASLTALQGRLLLTQVRRRVKALGVALDAALDHIEQHATSR